MAMWPLQYQFWPARTRASCALRVQVTLQSRNGRTTERLSSSNIESKK